MSAISKQYINLAYYYTAIMPIPRYLVDPSIKTLLKLSTLGAVLAFVKDDILFSCRSVDLTCPHRESRILTLKEIYSL